MHNGCTTKRSQKGDWRSVEVGEATARNLTGMGSSIQVIVFASCHSQSLWGVFDLVLKRFCRGI